MFKMRVKKKLHKRVKVVGDPWTPETGLVTDALKLKRKAIEQKFKDIIEDLYHDQPKKNPTKIKSTRVAPAPVEQAQRTTTDNENLRDLSKTSIEKKTE